VKLQNPVPHPLKSRVVESELTGARLRRGRLGSTVYFGLIPEGWPAISQVKLVSSDISIGHSIRTVLLRHTERLPGETAPFQLPSKEQNTVYTYAVERRQRRQRQHSLIRANWRNTPDHPLAAQLIRESHQESDGSRVAV